MSILFTTACKNPAFLRDRKKPVSKKPRIKTIAHGQPAFIPFDKLYIDEVFFRGQVFLFREVLRVDVRWFGQSSYSQPGRAKKRHDDGLGLGRFAVFLPYG